MNDDELIDGVVRKVLAQVEVRRVARQVARGETWYDRQVKRAARYRAMLDRRDVKCAFPVVPGTKMLDMDGDR